MSKKKVLAYVCNVDWYFALHWQERARAAQAAGYDVYLLTTRTNESTWTTLQKSFCCFHLPMQRSSVNIFFDLSYIIKLFFLLKEIQPDLLHCITIKPNIYGSISARLQARPCILSITGLGLIFSSPKTHHQLLRVVLTGFYRLAAKHRDAKFLFENNNDRAFFVSSGIIDKSMAAVIRGAGIDLDQFPYTLPPDNPQPIILFAARLLRSKGLECLVKAAAILQEKGITCHIKVAGISDTDCLEPIPLSQVKLWHNAGLIEWLGQRENMPRLLQEADIVTLPTVYGEGVPRILIEGAATGRPLVATDVTGCQDIVVHKQTGLLVKPGDPDSLAAALQTLIMNKELRLEYGRKGRQLVVDEFAQKKVIAETIALYSGFFT